ncbi:ArnT family glycosyltransferase [Flavobacterium cerinum]|uniref:Glycosyltransferase family 39 protein n=1 Tax=Flavobacterium cerinum TaxID=2502784 RepID=A0ABY5IX10_9FLAO|nr:glycosyltransferase family 39 protein [Flavobacterium cerinum]UUC46278.1 glycosyltransferase family 39 protein [Flavobacterium cerinum]
MLVFITYLLLLVYLIRFNKSASFKEIILRATLLFSTGIVVITELLSLVKSINLFSVVTVWGSITAILCFLIFRSRKEVFSHFAIQKKVTIQNYKALFFYEKFLLWSVFVFILLLLFQGIIYPPNNWDSLTYHMPRIMYWISNESVAHFPTHTIRDLYQPPLAEYFIMHVNLVNGNDYLSNSIQTFYLVNSCIVLWLILDLFKTPRLYKCIALLLAITIPSVELQATTTKNDIVCAFFVLVSSYYCIKSYLSGQFNHFVFLGLSLGLAFLTKGTAYLYLAPILLCYGLFILVRIIKTKNSSPLLYGGVVIILAILLNIGHYSRNYKIDGDILNIDKAEAQAYSNQKMDGKLFLSNFLKNAALHLGYPVSDQSDAVLKIIHTKINTPLDNPDTSYYGTPYEASKKIPTHEDLVSNTVHFLLFAFALLCLGISCIKNYKKNIPAVVITLVLLLQIIFFCAYLKWQPWHTRLHIPMFLLSIAAIILTANHSKGLRYVIIATLPVLYFSFFFFFIYNNTRPILFDRHLTVKVSPEDPRFKKYFSNKLSLQNEYADVLNIVYDNDSQNVGMIMDEWEYPLLYNFYYDPLKITAIHIHNISQKIPQDESGVDLIVSDHINQEFITLNGKKYFNKTPKNNYIWAYK